MNNIALSNKAEDFISGMHLPRQDQEVIRKCVSRYSKPNSFDGTLAWIVFRIANAIKSVFRKSEWQITTRFLHKHAINMAKSSNLIQLNNPDKVQKIINKKVIDQTGIVASKLLSKCLSAHQKNAELPEEAEFTDLKKIMEQIEVKIVWENLFRKHGLTVLENPGRNKLLFNIITSLDEKDNEMNDYIIHFCYGFIKVRDDLPSVEQLLKIARDEAEKLQENRQQPVNVDPFREIRNGINKPPEFFD